MEFQLRFFLKETFPSIKNAEPAAMQNITAGSVRIHIQLCTIVYRKPVFLPLHHTTMKPSFQSQDFLRQVCTPQQ